MLKYLEKQYSIIHIAGREYKVRYSLNCLLCLEVMYKPLSEILKVPYTDWTAEDVLQLTRAAMCDLPRNYKAVNRRDFENVRPTLSELGKSVEMQDLPLLRLEIINAIINSMPQTDGSETAEDDPQAANEGHLRAMYCDVIGLPERRFWRSNHREINDRINCYLEVKGLKETPTSIINQFDDGKLF